MHCQPKITIYFSQEHELLMLANGACFMSEGLYEKVIAVAGPHGLAYLLAHELAHLSKGHARHNVNKSAKRGDLKKQLLLSHSNYTGYDAIFQEYFTNQRFTREQEEECESLALKVLLDCGFHLSHDQYRSVLKLVQGEESLPTPEAVEPQTTSLGSQLVSRVLELRRKLVEAD